MKIRYPLIALSMLFGAVAAADAQVSVGIAAPGVSIGINLPVYPQLVLIPGYPVYYAPRANSNYFFYDGLYWVYQGDGWYVSSWYNGPWQLILPEYVPLFILRIPVRYYRYPPPYFRGWAFDAPPRWGDHWGRDWEQHRRGWDRWDHRSMPRPAPLPAYQRQYSGPRYPRAAEQQNLIRSERYRYRPHDAVSRQQLQQRGNSDRLNSEPQPQAPLQQHGNPNRPHPELRPQGQMQQRGYPDRPHPDSRPQGQMQQRPAAQQPEFHPNQQRQQMPVQPPPQMQRHQAEPQNAGRGHEAGPQNRGRQNNAERQDQDRGGKAER